jgi:hypothetical protein
MCLQKVVSWMYLQLCNGNNENDNIHKVNNNGFTFYGLPHVVNQYLIRA